MDILKSLRPVDIARVIVAVLFLAGALWIVIKMIQSLLKARAAKEWPIVTGTVTESLVEVIRKPDGQLYHQAHVEYQYQVGGQTFVGRQITTGESSVLLPVTDKGPEKTVAQYPVGQTVQVHYDPHQPQDAALELRVPNVRAQIVYVCLLVGFAALFTIFWQ